MSDRTQPAKSDGIAAMAARLHAYAAADKCSCGESKGHVGWLLCAFPDRAAPRELQISPNPSKGLE